MPKCFALNLRIVSVTPCKLHGGTTAATRLPSGRRESRIGFSSEMSSPKSACDVLDGNFKGLWAEGQTRHCLDAPGALDEHVLRPIDHDLADLRVKDQVLDRPQEWQDQFKAVVVIRVLHPRAAGNRTCSRR